MTAEAWPTEDAATAAVEAAARAAYEHDVEARREVFPPGVTFREWSDLDALEQHAIKDTVLPLVWAALAALPDPRYAAWQAGKSAATNSHPSWWNTLENPYPFPRA